MKTHLIVVNKMTDLMIKIKLFVRLNLGLYSFFRFCFFLCSFLFTLSFAKAEDTYIIRDAEIEETLSEIAKPIFKIAGLRPEDAKIYVINSDSINAFTIGNGYIFVNSGLLLKFKNPLNLVGILCHEVGHIAAGHITRLISSLQNRTQNYMIAMIATVFGAALTNSPEAIAALLGYSMTDERFFLKFSREQEFAADALAASYAVKLGYDANILIDVFDAFERMEILSGGLNLPIYIRSHPKSIDRISAIRKYITGKKYKPQLEMQQKYQRVINKLMIYLKPNAFAITDQYSKAMYLHKKGMSEESISILKELIKKHPKDDYYKATLAQILLESGKTSDAVKIYKSIYNQKTHILLKIEYAKAIIESNKNIDNAISILEKIKDYPTPFNSEIFRLLGTAYGKKNKNGMSFLMLAQEQMLLLKYHLAYSLLESSIDMMDPKTESSHIKKAKYLKELIEREHIRK